ncbi:SMI1/KNR4 family protein [Amycolatopsis rhabdoformis]|uniref:SMI1/KNR4 family protein n=1 Tax=Amycolatopsis rhabdoformis TaxID=1448059 RepID=A0ABZ1IHH0_9PSEU|nr:SMI1/KNR4 family protein [Amycolatopsis rhabdoformis]WSE33221.1 SMI1/KNR4 family protein [Amycolatopsis rhabdoformis]
MAESDRVMPASLVEAHREPFDHRDGSGVDFEPYQEFLSEAETADWWHSWTGNPAVHGAEFRVFGQDGTGGLAAFWLVREGGLLGEQPVVFLGSEGEVGVVAGAADGYLWLLADGFGPLEAISYPQHEHEPRVDARLTEIAERWAPSARQPASEVITAARAEFPNFEETVRSQCR